MIDVEDLIALVRNYNPRTDADLISRAYDYGREMHDGQKRRSGEDYFTHPIAVAAILYFTVLKTGDAAEVGYRTEALQVGSIEALVDTTGTEIIAFFNHQADFRAAE